MPTPEVLSAPVAPTTATPTTEHSFETRLATLRELHLSDKHLAAARHLSSLRADIDTALSAPSKPAAYVAAARSAQATLATPFFTHVAAECDEVLALRAALHAPGHEGWTLSYDGAETRVWYRREPNTASHTIMTEGEIRAPLLHVAALIYEADLYDRLFWYVTGARELPLPGATRLKRAAHIAVYAPWPLYKRDVAVYAYGVDALDEEDGCVMVVSRSLKDGDGVGEREATLAPRTVRVDMHNSGFELVPSGPGVVKARFLYNVDPHLSFMPMALINWIARTLCRWSLRTLESRARDLSKMPKEYEERLASEPVYEYIRSRLNEFWAGKGLSPEAVRSGENHAVQHSRHSDGFDPDATPGGPPASVMKQVVRSEAGFSASSARRSLSRLFSSAVVL